MRYISVYDRCSSAQTQEYTESENTHTTTALMLVMVVFRSKWYIRSSTHEKPRKVYRKYRVRMMHQKNIEETTTQQTNQHEAATTTITASSVRFRTIQKPGE